MEFGTRHPERHCFGSAHEWHAGKTIVLVGNDARAQGSAAGTRKPSYSKKCHLNHCERKERPLAAFQCGSERAATVVAKEPGNRHRETGGEKSW